MNTRLTRVIVTSLFATVFTVGAGFINTHIALADSAALGVTQVTATQTFATADNTFDNGWKWVFNVTVPTNETVLKMKFADWVQGSNIIPAGSNIRIYSAQSSNASDAAHALVLNTASATYTNQPEMDINTGVDLDSGPSGAPGRQIQVTVEARVPEGSAGGSYSTSYGIKSVPDTTKPVITLNGDASIVKEVGSTYTDAGATALDNVDGDVTSNIQLTGTVVTSTVGNYTLTYNVSDSVGNAATPVTRSVKVQDTIAPTITAPADVGNAEATGHTTAVDLGTPVVSDIGDSSPIIKNDAPTTFPLGETTVIWTATDASGNVSSTTQKVTIVDTTKPIIILNGSSTITVPVFGTYDEQGAVVTDNYDTGLTATTTGTVDVNNVGTYTLHYNVTDSNGNIADEITRTVNVIARPITVTADAQTKVYNTSDPELTYKITDGSLNKGDSFTGTLVRSSEENVGTYDITQDTLSAGSNYILTFVPAKLTITPATATISLGNLAQTYGSTGAVTIITDPANIATEVTYDGSVTIPTNAGTYAVVATITDSNYTGSVTGTLVIGKAKATVSATSDGKVYDGTKDAPITLTVNGAVNGDQLSATGNASFTDKKVENDKTIHVTGISLGNDNANYTFDTATTTQASITAKPLTVSATGVDKEYDGSAEATVKLTSTDIANSDDVTISGTSFFTTGPDAGNNKSITVGGIQLKGTDGTNYSLNSQTASATATISAKNLSISGVSIVNKVYDGEVKADATGTAKLNGIVGTDNVSVDAANASASFSDKSVGDKKPVTVIGYVITGGDAKNYSLTQPTGLTANITPLEITGSITANDKVYDGTTAATISNRTLSGFLGKDDVTYVGGTATFDNKDVGPGKTVTATGMSLSGADAGNYTVNTTVTTTANITQKPLEVMAATGKDKVYDGTNHIDDGVVKFTTDALLNDVVIVPTGVSYTLNSHDVGLQDVEVEGISITGVDSGNYHLEKTTATTKIDITPKPLTIPGLQAENKIYDGTTDATLSGADTLSGVVSGDAVNLTDAHIATFADKNVGNGKTVTVTGYSIDNRNYSLTQPTGLVANITPIVLVGNITTEASKVYDGNTTAVITDCSLSSGVINNETVTCNATNANYDDKNIGKEKTVTADVSLSGADNSNYTINNIATTKADITARSITVTAKTNSKIYDGNTSALAVPEITSGSLAQGDTTNFTETYNTADVGTGKTLTPVGVIDDGNGGNNYVLTSETDTTGVITADISALTTAKNTAQGLITANAPELTTVPGNHITGSLATLTSAIDAANATDAVSAFMPN